VEATPGIETGVNGFAERYGRPRLSALGQGSVDLSVLFAFVVPLDPSLSRPVPDNWVAKSVASRTGKGGALGCAYALPHLRGPFGKSRRAN
jgi:hypothetical protein